ncbi:MAG: metallophosphoesterase [Bacteriovoracaceae bacterium]|nr:metallophosphoesterase [Bacteriovoracaceae bacterium]
MRFLRKSNIKKTVLVLSDLHLGAGQYLNGRPNILEDFHYDKELVDFLEFYRSGDYANREVELIINGDLFDLLAVPFVPYFDDEFWSEEAALAKLELILNAHPEVIQGISDFISSKNKTVTYIIGNHDGEFVFDSLKNKLLKLFEEKDRPNFKILMNDHGEYSPAKGLLLKHGHEYEVANNFSPSESLIVDESGKKFFLPPWGSYYVIRVINKFKEQRDHINSVRPIKKFLINGLIYDTLTTMRFMFANAFYFIMVRFVVLAKQGEKTLEIFKRALEELELFQDYETLTEEFLEKRDEVGVLVVGHTHDPIHRIFPDGKIFINTGTWTDMHYLDFDKTEKGSLLTYAQINVLDEKEDTALEASLLAWKGAQNTPYQELS